MEVNFLKILYICLDIVAEVLVIVEAQGVVPIVGAEVEDDHLINRFTLQGFLPQQERVIWEEPLKNMGK